ncbi:MAG: DUF4169 family protein [Henriciella sp.]|nr:DUF4169 family protein [Henriciella sp.]
MVEPINLNKARKAKAKAEKTQKAAENRIKFGRTKTEKQRDRLEAERRHKLVDDSQRED